MPDTCVPVVGQNKSCNQKEKQLPLKGKITSRPNPKGVTAQRGHNQKYGGESTKPERERDVTTSQKSPKTNPNENRSFKRTMKVCRRNVDRERAELDFIGITNM